MTSAAGECPQGTDLVGAFGPLASMHAALDTLGVGQPCVVAAHFNGVSIEAVKDAIARAEAFFPILSCKVAWNLDRPLIMASPLVSTMAEQDLRFLNFSGRQDGRVWAWRVRRTTEGVWFEAAFLHSVADGLSMLRFVHAVADNLGAAAGGGRLNQARLETQPYSQAVWTARFIINQVRLLARPGPPTAAAAYTAVWTHLDAYAANRVFRRAAVCGSVAGLLSAVSLLTMADDEGASGFRSLEVPVVRSNLPEWNGFGFGVGAVLLPTFIDRRVGVEQLSASITRRLRAAVDQGWDKSLERFLGDDPRRHLRYAEHHRRRPQASPLTVSWKGAGLWHENAIIGDVACFSAAPNLHVSAHGDGRGLSISVTGPFGPDRTKSLLDEILRRLDVSPTRPIHFLGGGSSPNWERALSDQTHRTA